MTSIKTLLVGTALCTATAFGFAQTATAPAASAPATHSTAKPHSAAASKPVHHDKKDHKTASDKHGKPHAADAKASAPAASK
jgi:hypothetical protein